jgi:hypothetical protein
LIDAGEVNKEKRTHRFVGRENREGDSVLGAIMVVGGEDPTNYNSGGVRSSSHWRGQALRDGGSLACMEVVGRSMVDVMIEDLRKRGVGPVSVLVGRSRANDATQWGGSMASNNPVESCRMEDVASSVGLKLKAQHESGTETTIVVRMGAYVELDPSDALRFHREQRQPATRAQDVEGPLDIWVVETAHFAAGDNVLGALQHSGGKSYEVTGYVNRLAHPRDLRRLAVDALTRRCRLRPQGDEVQPGVWLGQGAQVHREARVVAPAFIGRESTIKEGCLITECSSVESNSEVDCGTAVSDTSLLSNSYVGIGLDIRHSVVNGDTLVSLEHDVTLEIGDSGVMRQNRAPRKDTNRETKADAGIGMLFTPTEEAAN